MNDINDVKEPVLLAYNYWPVVIFLAIIVIALMLLIYYSLKKKQKPVPVEEIPVNIKLSARQIALKELSKVLDDKLIEKGKYELFYNRLTDIIKNYLSIQFNLDVESKTTTEIIYQLKTMNLDYDFIKQLNTCLKDFDFAKYTSYKSSEKDMRESIDLAFTLFKLEEKISVRKGPGEK